VNTGDPEAPTLSRSAAVFGGTSAEQGDAIFVFGAPDAFPYATQPTRVWAQFSEEPAHECWSLV